MNELSIEELKRIGDETIKQTCIKCKEKRCEKTIWTYNCEKFQKKFVKNLEENITENA